MYNCNKCNESNLILQAKSHNTGLYCKACGAWQKWLNKEEVRTAEFNGVPTFEGPITTDVLTEENTPTKTVSTPAGSIEDLFINASASIEDLFVNSAPFEDNNTIDVKDKVKVFNNNNHESSANKSGEETVAIEIPLSKAKDMLELLKTLEKQIEKELK